ncbi:hypothetical protein J2776_000222 [Paraburkholderia caledonica]|uniref:Uncharacterized protein n=1 Tax=Paraburkholderia caledonica TaxID=134536 RepID=A0ABU1KRH5_9BURK|nr:hypothetical protein [Paraburkholderia caledonica]
MLNTHYLLLKNEMVRHAPHRAAMNTLQGGLRS